MLIVIVFWKATKCKMGGRKEYTAFQQYLFWLYYLDSLKEMVSIAFLICRYYRDLLEQPCTIYRVPL